MVLRENFGRTGLISMAMKQHLGGLQLIPLGSNSDTRAETRFKLGEDRVDVEICYSFWHRTIF